MRPFPRSLMRSFSRKFTNLSGIFPPIATPFDTKLNIDYDALAQNFQQWNKISFSGYVVQGSNGEYPFMTADERITVVREAKKLIPNGRLLIAGSGCESSAETVRTTERMAEAGADAALIVTPSFYKSLMNNTALIAHFTQVADSSPIPIILYNVPSNTGVELQADVAITMASHPNVIGLKDSGGDVAKLAHIVSRTKDCGFQVLAGSAGFLYPALVLGCTGGVLALANILGAECYRLFELYHLDLQKEASSLQQRLVSPNACVTRRYGVAGLKSMMDWFGYIGGPCRPPLQPSSSTEVAVMKREFKLSGFVPKHS